ncbi:MAG TPA: chemotaxis protein CheW [Vicinamibacterales bacterium]
MTAQGLLRCTAGADHFALRADDVRHVARADQVRPDDTPDGRCGFVKLGSQHVPVFCLRQALGLAPLAVSAGGDRHVAVTGEQHDRVGWIVDRVTREPRAGIATLAPLPPSIGGQARRWFDGVAIGNDGPMLLINPVRLNPLGRARQECEDLTPALAPPPLADHHAAEPVALVFSTAALPSADVDKFALSGRQVAAIVPSDGAMQVPGCAAHVAGLTVWRDIAVPIVDFRDRSSTTGRDERRLIARCAQGGRSLIAITIEADVRMHRPAAGDRLVTDVACPPFASGVFDLNGHRVALLDLDAVLAGTA